MSGVSSGVSQSGYGLLGQLIRDSQTVSKRLDVLTEQASSGLISQTYSGLSAGGAVSLKLNPQMDALQTWQDNIGQATGGMQVAQTAMTQAQSVAASFVTAMNSLNGLNPASIDSVAANARAALTQVAGLLNTQNGGVYLFSGEDSANPPVPSPDDILTSGFYTQINSAVTGLATNGASATIAATLAVGQSNVAGTSPFSAYMSQPASSISSPVVHVGPNSTVQTGFLASANSVSSSTGASSTGSYMRDLMRALATIGSMSSSQSDDQDFGTLVQDTRTSLIGVVSSMATDVGVMGSRQAGLAATKTQLSDTAVAMKAQLTDAQEVNMAQTLSELTQTQTQLQASYQLITGKNALSLVKFLPSG
jgi:flagellar hook-associated protein 3 FlgL